MRKKVQPLEVFMEISVGINKKCFPSYFEAPEIESSPYHLFFSKNKTSRFLKTPRFRILRTSALVPKLLA